MPRMSGPRVGIRAVLILGFGLTLGLWAFTAYSFTAQMAEAERRGAVVLARYNRAQELLSTVRAQILLISVHVRDALLDPDRRATDKYRRRIDESYTRIESALGGYSPVPDATGERDDVLRLRAEIEQFRGTMTEMLDLHASGRPVDVRDLLNRRMVPRRESAIGFSEQVQALNRAAFVRQQAASAAIHQAAERRSWWYLGVALMASLGIALFATAYSTRLEAKLRTHSERESRAAGELQRLSAALIDAQEAERRRLARELHDDVGQLLTAIKMEVAAVQRTGSDLTGLVGAQAIADGALQRLRNLSHALHPSILDDLGLGEAVAWYLRSLAGPHAVAAELVCHGTEQQLPDEVATAAFRIVQEAVTNVVRHSGASRCEVQLAWTAEALAITVTDDGRGCAPRHGATPDGEPRGLGLIGMRERATQFGGTFEVNSGVGRGTTVRVCFPLASGPSATTVGMASLPQTEVAHG